jgi:hypothetical protein
MKKAGKGILFEHFGKKVLNSNSAIHTYIIDKAMKNENKKILPYD